MLNLKTLEEIFRGNLNIEDLKILKNHTNLLEKYKGYKKLPLDGNYVLLIKSNLPYDKLIKFRDFIADYIQNYKELNKTKTILKVLEREFNSILYVKNIFVGGEYEKEALKKYFSSIDNCKFAFQDKDKVVINTGIDEDILKVILRNLNQINEITFQYMDGEIFAVKVSFFSIVIYNPNGKIEDFYKNLIKTKLFILDRVYNYVSIYSIDELTEFYTKKKLIADLPELEGKPTLVINIRNFNYINSIFGIKFGDKVLKEFSSLIKELVKNSKYIYRITGDKFAVVFHYMKEATEFFKKLEKVLEHGINIYHEATLEFVTVSLSIQGVLIEELKEHYIESAIVYLKKQNFHEKSFIVFEDEILPIMKSDLESLKIVQKAIAKDAIVPVFQKIKNMKNGQCFYEALMRIKFKNEVYTPAQFLEVSKEKGLYPRLSEKLLTEAIKYAKYLGRKVSVNVEITDILRDSFVNFLVRLVDKNGLKRSDIILEITESEYMGNYFKEVKKVVEKLRKDDGFIIAIDDFGSGYSNFSYLTEIPVDIIKIDGGLIKNIPYNEKYRYIVASIVSLAQYLGIKTVAEFVSNEEIYKEVERLDIDYAQGFYIAKPKFIEEILEEMESPSNT